jgi:antitoxin component YwqK of YwqJK toxin-antitoxin module
MKIGHLMHLYVKLVMKLIVLMLCLLFSHICYSQTYRFQLYRTAACKTSSYLDSDYALYKIPGSIDTDYYPKAGTVYLPGPGRYGLELGDAPTVDTVFDIRDTGLFVFKYKEPDVGFYYSTAVDDFGRYMSCGKEIQGYFECRYSDGKMKMKGNFVDGVARDSLLTYYSNGQLKTRWRRFKRYHEVEAFDSIGHKEEILTGENGSFMTYHWRKAKEFFPDGKIKLVASNVKHIGLIREYYPNGQIKIEQTTKHRFEFYENGRPKVTYTWKKHIDRVVPPEKGRKDFTVKQTNYDPDGGILQIMIFEVNDVFGLPPKLEIDEYDWVDRLTKYNDGKVVFEIKDMDAKEYLKKYGDKNK